MTEQFKYATATETRIAKAVVSRLINLGFEIAVNDGEEVVTPVTTDTKTIYDAMNSTDMDYVLAYKNGERAGSVLLIWGNGEDLISDMSETMEEHMRGVV